MIGALSTVAHVSIFFAAVHFLEASGLLANALAWGVAFLLSFCGHFYWTFSKADVTGSRSPAFRRAFIRFLVTSLVGLAVNMMVVYLSMYLLALGPAVTGVLIVLTVPVVSFVLSKLWAFAPMEHEKSGVI